MIAHIGTSQSMALHHRSRRLPNLSLKLMSPNAEEFPYQCFGYYASHFIPGKIPRIASFKRNMDELYPA
jgi:predicted aconitase